VKDFSLSKKWLLIIFISSISLIIFSGTTADAQTGTLWASEEARGKSAYLFKISGLTGSSGHGGDIDQFVKDNNGFVQNSNYNWITTASDPGGSTSIAGCSEDDENDTDGKLNPPFVRFGNPRGWGDVVNQYWAMLHNNNQFLVPGLPEVNTNSKLLLMGYSFGGGTATMIATDPRNADIRFDFVYTNDPVGPNGNRFNALANVGYEHSDIPCIGGTSAIAINSFVPCLIPQELVTLAAYDVCKNNQMNTGTTFAERWRVFGDNVRFLLHRVQDAWIPPADVLATPQGQGGAALLPFWRQSQAIVPGDTILVGGPCRSDALTAILAFKFSEVNCGHTYMSDKDLVGYFIAKEIMKQMNKQPDLSTGVPIEIMELDLITTPVATDFPANTIPFSGGNLPVEWETTQNMELKFRLNPGIDNGVPTGIEPISIEKVDHGTHITSTAIISSSSLDGGVTPTTHNVLLQVEDNGFPCRNCQGDMLDASLSAKGDWDRETLQIIVTNSPPIPTIIGTTASASTHGISDECLPDSDALIIDNDSIEILIHTLDSEPDMNAGMSYTISWGDGSPDSVIQTNSDIAPSFQHDYDKIGNFMIDVTTTDKDGDDGMTSLKVSSPDNDCDGIHPNIDTLPEEFSNDFASPEFPFCEVNAVFNSNTGKCEWEPCPVDWVHVGNDCHPVADPAGLEPAACQVNQLNPITDLCEADSICPASTLFNPESMVCEVGAEGTIVDRGEQNVFINDSDPGGIFFNAEKGGGETPATIIACDKAGQIEVDSGDSGNITCGSITVSIVTGSVDVQFNTGAGPATTTMGALDSITFDGDTLTFTNNSLTNTAVIKIAGRTITLAPGETITVTFPTSKTSYQDPNLGDVRHGQGHDNGFCMNQNCINVDGFFNHFPETIIPQGSTQTFSLLINCPRGVDTCNHATIEGVLPDSDFYDEQWGVTLERLPRSDTWETTINNPYGEIGEVTTTVQEVGQSFLSVTYNIEFLIPGSIGTADGIRVPHENNRFLHVTVWDSNRGISNYIFNEGVYIDDIYAYPKVEASYDAAIELEPLCLNENANKRYTCAFDKVREWTIKNGEKALLEINGITELDVLNEEFLSKFKELKQAIADENSEKISEIRAQLDELGTKIHNQKQ